mgnify:FL=1
MIMPRGQQLLLPVNPGFITASLLLALAINLLPLGPMVWMPDALILALAFWGVHQPWRVGMGIGFVLGLCMDVHQSSLLGQHALAYTVLMYGTRVFHRRVLWLRPLQQPWQMVGLFAAAHAAYVLAGLLAGRGMPGWGVVLAPLLEALLWPLVSWMLLAPQRRSVDGQDKLP